jgi:pimeloyl-ACP methyl ester carboxylesterase
VARLRFRLVVPSAYSSQARLLWLARHAALTHRARARVQFLQTAHPPQRRFNGRTPRVHRGFLATWQANGVRDRVLAYIETLLGSHPDKSQVKIVCTGHSLGGAVATLAAALRHQQDKHHVLHVRLPPRRCAAPAQRARAALGPTARGRGGLYSPGASTCAARVHNKPDC